MTTGYSKKPLLSKLGIKSGNRLLILGMPDGYLKTLGELPKDVTLLSRLSSSVHFIQYFATNRSKLVVRFAKLSAALTPSGMLWISWPKLTSGKDTDLTRDIIREIGLTHGLVDVKICAIDDVWSGLKFVRRLSDR